MKLIRFARAFCILISILLCGGCSLPTYEVKTTRETSTVPKQVKTILAEIEYIELPPQPQAKPIISVYSDNIFINDESIITGQITELAIGTNTVIFRGEHVIQTTEEIKTAANSVDYEGIKVISCIAVLPLCALLHATNDDTYQVDDGYRINNTTMYCEAEVNFYASLGGEYSIDINEHLDAPPLLVIKQTSFPGTNLLRESLECKPIDVID